MVRRLIDQLPREILRSGNNLPALDCCGTGLLRGGIAADQLKAVDPMLIVSFGLITIGVVVANYGTLYDALNVSLIIGGSIVVPHLRHAVETIDLLRAEKAGSK